MSNTGYAFVDADDDVSLRNGLWMAADDLQFGGDAARAGGNGLEFQSESINQPRSGI